jgi:hypothetical protein
VGQREAKAKDVDSQHKSRSHPLQLFNRKDWMKKKIWSTEKREGQEVMKGHIIIENRERNKK